jgi:hypothetical protein
MTMEDKAEARLRKALEYHAESVQPSPDAYRKARAHWQRRAGPRRGAVATVPGPARRAVCRAERWLRRLLRGC